MDIHIIYHLVFYVVLFVFITLFSRDREIIIIIALLTLPLAGEVAQIYISQIAPDHYHLWFSFEWKDVVVNTSGALFGTLTRFV
jgi:hypothetical protein